MTYLVQMSTRESGEFSSHTVFSPTGFILLPGVVLPVRRVTMAVSVVVVVMVVAPVPPAEPHVLTVATPVQLADDDPNDASDVGGGDGAQEDGALLLGKHRRIRPKFFIGLHFLHSITFSPLRPSK